jgi:hypothetical protein
VFDTEQLSTADELSDSKNVEDIKIKKIKALIVKRAFRWFTLYKNSL